jgi:hypothetical protein
MKSDVNSGRAFDDHGPDLVTQSERPGQRFRPVSFEDVQIGAAHSARTDLEHGSFFSEPPAKQHGGITGVCQVRRR